MIIQPKLARRAKENAGTSLFTYAFIVLKCPLWKYTYSNILKLYHKKKKKKKENFGTKNSDIFHISAQNIDCGTR